MLCPQDIGMIYNHNRAGPEKKKKINFECFDKLGVYLSEVPNPFQALFLPKGVKSEKDFLSLSLWKYRICRLNLNLGN